MEKFGAHITSTERLPRMSNPDTHIPNLITQVQADDEDVDYDDPYYAGGISARREPGEGAPLLAARPEGGSCEWGKADGSGG